MTDHDPQRRADLAGRSPGELTGQSRRKLTLGNAISLLRIVLLPFLLYAISLPPVEGRLAVVVLSAAIAGSDMLDGFVARRLNQVSELGMILDPVADKICVGAVAVSLCVHRDLPLWIVVAAIGRDVVILTGSVIIARKRSVVLPSVQLGRLTTLVLTVTLFSSAIDWQWPLEALLYASGAAVAVTAVVYCRIGWYVLRK